MEKNIKTFGKQLMTAVLTVAILVSGLAICCSAETVDRFGDDHKAYDERLYGDVNLDWKVDAIDYMLLKRAVLGTFSISKQDLRQTDINQNGEIDAIDYMLVKRSVLGTVASLGFAPQRELTAKAADALSDEELYDRIDKEIAEAIKYDATDLLIRFQRITRETQAAEILSSLGLPDDLNDKSVYIGCYWGDSTYGTALSIRLCVPAELSLRDTLFKLYCCAELYAPMFMDLYAPEA